jgi:phosphohistidine phosphatase
VKALVKAAEDRFVIVLRHGIAEEKGGDKPDEERSLTAEGHAKMKQIARGLHAVFPKAQAVYSSPLVRAVQTALWVSKAYRSRIKVNTTEVLKPGASTKDFLDFIKDVPERRFIVVGHEPGLSSDFKALVGLDKNDPMELKKGGCYGARLRPDGSASFEWLLTPRVLRRLN